jgi:hypothetical protein
MTLKEKVWNFLAFTLENKVGTLYLNGSVATRSVNMNIPNAVRRSNCYLGRNNKWVKNSEYNEPANIFSLFDDIKIHNRALNQNEVKELMKIKF